MHTVKEILSDPRAVVIFDIDGTLTEYTYGERTLMPKGMDGSNLDQMSTCSGLREMAKTRDIYSEVEALPAIKDYIDRHGTDRIFVCSVEMEGREKEKISMCERVYGIPASHVCFVQDEVFRAEEKTLVIDTIRRKYFPELEPKWFVMVDDSSHLLRKMTAISDYSTALVTVFLSYPWKVSR